MFLVFLLLLFIHVLHWTGDLVSKRKKGLVETVTGQNNAELPPSCIVAKAIPGLNRISSP